MSSFTDIWSNLLQAGKPTPYLLIDCAGIEGGEARIPKQIFSELECLFTGDLAVELADVGPYLGRLRSFDTDVAKAVEDLLSRYVGTLVILEDPEPSGPELTFSQLHRHFRKFNVVFGPDNEPLFFRYYDPRVLVDVLKVIAYGEVEAFFGPANAFFLADLGKNIVHCYKQGGAFTVLSN